MFVWGEIQYVCNLWTSVHHFLGALSLCNVFKSPWTIGNISGESRLSILTQTAVKVGYSL